MKTLLVLSSNREFFDAISAGLDSSAFKTVERVDLTQAEPLFRAALVDFCILDLAADEPQALWLVERLRGLAPDCPVLVFTDQKNPHWEEEAYLQGALHVLAKPVRPRMVQALIERFFRAKADSSQRESHAAKPISPHPGPVSRAEGERMPANVSSRAGFSSAVEALKVLRDFSVVLTHSLQAEGLLREFLFLLRGILGVNRAAIFLRDQSAAQSHSGGRMRSACAVGLQTDLLNHLDLSYDRGIGGYLARAGRILRRDEATAATDDEIQKEFQVLGAQVAVPILDRETLIGVALFDDRVTGEPLLNSELESIFHLLEGLALAVRNIWLHDQMASQSEMLSSVLRELTSACVVVNRDLAVVHANRTARQYFARSGRREIEFSDLPAALGNKVYQVLKTGTAIAPYKYEPDDEPNKTFQVSIVPFHRSNGTVGVRSAGSSPPGSPVEDLPETVLLVVEDRTQSQQLQKLEVEAANLRLVRAMADRLAHEIGNALVPLSTHQQLLADKYRDPEFRASLDVALADGVKRVSRLTSQMRYLARDAVLAKEPLPLKQLIDEAYQEAQKHHTQKPAKLQFQNGAQPLSVAGDHAALKHAMAEVLLNAMQANNGSGKIDVSAQAVTDAGGSRWVQIAIEDAGEGFTPEAARRVPEPFFTTRNVGLGLGLTVSRKIIEIHQGRLQIEPPKAGQHGLVRISLPADS
jgi:signal transduction histidine kinase/CheY-like chemotaxis protein